MRHFTIGDRRPALDILIACALRTEVSALRLGRPKGCRHLVSGLGISRTGKSLIAAIAERQPDLLIFTGTAGQLHPEIAMGDIVFPENWCFEDGSCHPNRNRPYLAPGFYSGKLHLCGRGLSVRTPVLWRRRRLSLASRHRALACDMEAAEALRVARQYNIPCWAFKIVSDTAAEGIIRSLPHFSHNMKRLGVFIADLIDLVQCRGLESSEQRSW